jgi:polar amino acid transport system permease protein
MSEHSKAGPEARTETLPIVPLRHWGRWIAAVAILLVAASIIYVLAQADIAYRDVPNFILFPVMLEGLWHTIVLAIAAQSAGIAIGLIVAIMRRSENPVAWCTAGLYIWVFRGVPVLLQLLIWYNLALAFKVIGIPGLFSISTNALITPFVAGLLGLGLNESAYMAEIIRAGFNSIDKGQVEAAHAIGMTPGKTLRRVILPQAMRVIIPPTGNDFINMLKETSLVSVISYVELIQAANNISSHNLEVMETLLAAAIWYMVLVTIASVGQHYLELSLAGGPHRSGGVGPGQAILRALAAVPFTGR